MKTEKMKLQILDSVSGDLARHIDHVYDSLSKLKDETVINLDVIIEDYISYHNRSAEILNETRINEAVETKRDIAFIYYCISCPFYFNLGASERLTYEQRNYVASTLNISPPKFTDYITSAKHHYRIYASYREMINSFVQKYIKKE